MIVRSFLAIALVLGVGGCAHVQAPRANLAERQWPVTLLAAKHALSAERPANADQILLEFAERFAGTAEAQEARYWRAMVALHTAQTRETSLDSASVLLERYIAEGPGSPRYLEAAALRKLIAQSAALQNEMLQVRRALSQARTEQPRERPAEGAAAAPRQDRNLVAEVESLRGELNRANQELERIRRRLAGQNP
jgi:outer membrane protein assembly factor BamD (BamD/ComL family)